MSMLRVPDVARHVGILVSILVVVLYPLIVLIKSVLFQNLPVVEYFRSINYVLELYLRFLQTTSPNQRLQHLIQPQY